MPENSLQGAIPQLQDSELNSQNFSRRSGDCQSVSCQVPWLTQRQKKAEQQGCIWQTVVLSVAVTQAVSLPSTWSAPHRGRTANSQCAVKMHPQPTELSLPALQTSGEVRLGRGPRGLPTSKQSSLPTQQGSPNSLQGWAALLFTTARDNRRALR